MGHAKQTLTGQNRRRPTQLGDPGMMDSTPPRRYVTRYGKGTTGWQTRRIDRTKRPTQQLNHP
jgi:hypothetical protein